MSLKHQLDTSLADYLNGLGKWDDWAGSSRFYQEQQGAEGTVPPARGGNVHFVVVENYDAGDGNEGDGDGAGVWEPFSEFNSLSQYTNGDIIWEKEFGTVETSGAADAEGQHLGLVLNADVLHPLVREMGTQSTWDSWDGQLLAYRQAGGVGAFEQVGFQTFAWPGGVLVDGHSNTAESETLRLSPEEVSMQRVTCCLGTIERKFGFYWFAVSWIHVNDNDTIKLQWWPDGYPKPSAPTA